VFESSGISAIAFSPDGSSLALAGEQTVSIFNTQKWQTQLSVQVREGPVTSLAFSPDSRWFAAGIADRGKGLPSLNVWEKATGSFVTSVNCECGRVNSVVFAPGGGSIATAGEDGSVKVWDTSIWKLDKILSKHEERATALAYSQDGRLIVSEDLTGLVIVWDVSSGEIIAELPGNDGLVSDALAFAYDGSTLATVASWEESFGSIRRSKILLWDTSTWKVRGELRGHMYTVSGLAFHPREKTLASVGAGLGVDEIFCWDADTMKGRFVIRFPRVRYSSCKQLRFSPDGKMLVCGTTWQSLCVWDWDKVLQAVSGN
jgi:WD40 repeat protein